jgi:ATP-dependent Clp protease adapter protein ClpS
VRLALTTSVVQFAGLLDKPGLDLGTRGEGMPEPEFGAGDMDRVKETGGGRFRLLLLDSAKHTESKVVAAITLVVPNIDAEQAANCYHTAKKLGMAIITSCLKEHAEMYAVQLAQKGCRTRIEPDSIVL